MKKHARPHMHTRLVRTRSGMHRILVNPYIPKRVKHSYPDDGDMNNLSDFEKEEVIIQDKKKQALFMKDPKPAIRRFVIEYTDDPKVVKLGAMDPDWSVRAKAATKRELDEEAQLLLSQDPSEDVRAEIAKRADDFDILRPLMRDKSKLVKRTTNNRLLSILRGGQE